MLYEVREKHIFLNSCCPQIIQCLKRVLPEIRLIGTIDMVDVKLNKPSRSNYMHIYAQFKQHFLESSRTRADVLDVQV